MKIKSIYLVLFFLFCIAIFFENEDANAQTFMKYKTWATEKHRDPGENDTAMYTRLGFRYRDVFNSVTGNFNNDYDNYIPINEIQLLVNRNNNLKIYSVETQTYRVLDPSGAPEVDYSLASVVNTQEGLTPPRALEIKSVNPDNPIPRYDAYDNSFSFKK
jgi:hypothetical protein